MSVKIYTKTKHQKVKNTYVQKMYGVIEGPVHLMMRYFPKEFSFMRHQNKYTISKTKNNDL